MTPDEQVAKCLDCGMPYSGFGVDVVLPDDEWRLIHPDVDGLLCPTCIARRVWNVPGAIRLRASFCNHAADAEREKEIDEAWLRSLGWREWHDADDAMYGGTFYTPCGEWIGWKRRLVWILNSVEVIRLSDGRSDGVEIVAESVTLLGNPATIGQRATRGQLLDLLKCLRPLDSNGTTKRAGQC